MKNEFVITATRSMVDYASRVIEYIVKLPSFSASAKTIDGSELLHVKTFANGEMEVEVSSSIRGKDVILFASAAKNQSNIGVSEAKIEMYHAVDALKRAQAEKIIVFEPFVSCSRSDRAMSRGSVGLAGHFKILTSLGIRQFVTYQLHSDKSRSIMDPTVCVLDDIPALNLLKKYLCDVYIRDLKTLEIEVRPHWVFCSVDAGGEKLAQDFADSFGAQLAIAHKQRDYSTPNIVSSITLLSAESIEGKVIWIVDDMIDTGGSVEQLILELARHKPGAINIITVHAVFSPPAAERLNRLSRQGLLHRILVSDTAYCPDSVGESGRLLNIEVVPSTELSAKIIRTIVTFGSMRSLLDRFIAETYLGSPDLFNQ
jgi:ribose-phosphate pyrophosphokinase